MKLLKVIKEHRETITVDILLDYIYFMHILRNISFCELFFMKIKEMFLNLIIMLKKALLFVNHLLLPNYLN